MSWNPQHFFFISLLPKHFSQKIISHSKHKTRPDLYNISWTVMICLCLLFCILQWFLTFSSRQRPKKSRDPYLHKKKVICQSQNVFIERIVCKTYFQEIALTSLSITQSDKTFRRLAQSYKRIINKTLNKRPKVL